MGKGIGSFFLLVFLSAAPAPATNQEVPIDVWPVERVWQGEPLDQGLIVQAIRAHFDLEPYHRVAVKVQWIDGRAKSLLVFLLSKDTYSTTIHRITLGERGEVLAVELNYQLTDADEEVERGTYASCPDPSVQMIFSSCEQTIPSAISAVGQAGQYAARMGYKYRVLKGNEENVAAIRSWYSCPNLILHGRVGHGYTTGVVFADGIMSYSAFRELPPRSMNCKALYYNSCDVHNPPLEPAIMGAGTQIFIGGNVTLEIGRSEEVFKCWMQKTLLNNEEMKPNVQRCELETGYRQGDHGVTQDPSQSTRICLGSSSGPASGGSSPGTSTPGAGGVDPCQDKSPYCAYWASRGECQRNPAYMLTYCCASCRKLP